MGSSIDAEVHGASEPEDARPAPMNLSLGFGSLAGSRGTRKPQRSANDGSRLEAPGQGWRVHGSSRKVNEALPQSVCIPFTSSIASTKSAVAGGPGIRALPAATDLGEATQPGCLLSGDFVTDPTDSGRPTAGTRR